MCTECKILTLVFGNTMHSHITFMDDLKSKVKLREVSTLNDCDIIIAFVSIVSRAGTDLGAALQKIPSNYPVILVALHNTFDKDRIVPDSRYVVNRPDIFTVDCLYYEDTGLLKAQCNSKALNDVVNKIQEIRKDRKDEKAAFSQLDVVETRNMQTSCALALVNILLIYFFLPFIVCIPAIALYAITFFIMTSKGCERLIPNILIAFIFITCIFIVCFSLPKSVHENGDRSTENRE